jgi:hypothetical protein
MIFLLALALLIFTGGGLVIFVLAGVETNWKLEREDWNLANIMLMFHVVSWAVVLVHLLEGWK